MYLSFGLLALLLGVMFTAVYLPLAKRLRFLDAPNHRSAHVVVTPSSGGLAIVAAIVVSLLASEAFGQNLDQASLSTMLWLIVAVCALGAWDDRRPVPVYLRLAVFLLLSALAVFASLGSEPMPSWMWPLLVVGFAWLLNLYNFMDGIDGLAALHTVMVAGGMLAVALITGAERTYLMLCVIIIGGYAGFLAFNWPPAKLFMGDAGSLSAGMLIGWLGLLALQDAHLPTIAWWLLMSPFLLDTGVTLMERVIQRERLTEAHSGHCYQRLARHWGSHRRVDLALLLLHLCWLLPLAILSAFGGLPEWTLLFLGLFPQLLLIAKLRRLK
ncbi:glycosyltransferase family 4 protein [Congregibacter brevis]|uniref:Glycosyltransferase family 4 protein n=1 Tax=Congregibacter brevis TaxID=3081201 RepID=A0ABZ0IHC2_9GAMM|nr:glycosyltransferase family 4 protein [Congregibacter sp. IMCC45268]